jgi:hypothetical protein
MNETKRTRPAVPWDPGRARELERERDEEADWGAEAAAKETEFGTKAATEAITGDGFERVP